MTNIVKWRWLTQDELVSLNGWDADEAVILTLCKCGVRSQWADIRPDASWILGSKCECGEREFSNCPTLDVSSVMEESEIFLSDVLTELIGAPDEST